MRENGSGSYQTLTIKEAANFGSLFFILVLSVGSLDDDLVPFSHFPDDPDGLIVLLGLDPELIQAVAID
jgi:hypothetical protein